MPLYTCFYTICWMYWHRLQIKWKIKIKCLAGDSSVGFRLHVLRLSPGVLLVYLCCLTSHPPPPERISRRTFAIFFGLCLIYSVLDHTVCRLHRKVGCEEISIYSQINGRGLLCMLWTKSIAFISFIFVNTKPLGCTAVVFTDSLHTNDGT
jgi:hypothetical protein